MNLHRSPFDPVLATLPVFLRRTPMFLQDRVISIVLATLFAAPAFAQGTAAPDSKPLLIPARAFVTAFNSHREELPKGVFVEDAAIIDAFPPFKWGGSSGSAARWYSGLMGLEATPEERAKRLASKQHFEIGAPRFVQVEKDGAYLVIPGVLTWLENGKAKKQTGQWVLAETHVGDAWLISAHAWAITSETP
jgi:hypothetical protein